jgi:endonuclease-3
MKESRVERQARAVKIIKILQAATRDMLLPASTQIVARYGKDPYLILVGCLLSLRTQDTVSFPASCRLFAKAKTPKSMLKLPISTIEKLIYPVGFYRNKAKILHSMSKDLLERFGGKVPKTSDELLSIKGIGLKTANLVLGEAFGVPALCVDTHVHRISNRLGLVKTKTPEETERALQQIVPKKYWVEFGKLLVTWGQNICVPILPKCSECAISKLCPKIGVTKSR